MTKIEIKHRWTGNIIYATEVGGDDPTPIRTYLARANLDGANLDGANLDGAYLARAYLAGANLDGANLDGANLASANLARAKNLPSGVTAVDPPEPYAIVVAQSLADRAKRYRDRHPEVPVVERLDARILKAITDGDGRLYMGAWHQDQDTGLECGTTHCRGGWAIHLAGKAGYELERKVGVERAAAMIYTASTGRAPNFFATDERALEDIKACAAAQSIDTDSP